MTHHLNSDDQWLTIVPGLLHTNFLGSSVVPMHQYGRRAIQLSILVTSIALVVAACSTSSSASNPSRAYVVNNGITPVNLTSGTAGKMIRVPGQAEGQAIAVTPNGKTA